MAPGLASIRFFEESFSGRQAENWAITCCCGAVLSQPGHGELGDVPVRKMMLTLAAGPFWWCGHCCFCCGRCSNWHGPAFTSLVSGRGALHNYVGVSPSGLFGAQGIALARWPTRDSAHRSMCSACWLAR